MVQPTKTRISADEYYQLPEYEQRDLIQLIDGEVIIGTAATLKHQGIVREILVLLTLHMRRKGGNVFASPIDVSLDNYNSFEPDVLYLKPDSKCVIDDKRLIGAPDLVVEVLSPSTAKYDKQEKYEAYERHGVGEYWIVDPVHELIEIWTLGGNGRFERQGAFGTDKTFKSVTLDENVIVKDIFNV